VKFRKKPAQLCSHQVVFDTLEAGKQRLLKRIDVVSKSLVE
jgi:hypothetical protein